jgi:thiamine biosynthesis lipoprotein
MIPQAAWSRREFFAGRPSATTPAADHWIRVHRRAMACRFEITLAGEDARWVTAARAALNGIDRIEGELSVFRDSSAISAVNRCAAEAPVTIGAEFFDLLRQCAALHRDTGGAFDVTSTPLSRCWGFLQREGRLPPLDALEAARAKVGFDRVALDTAAHAVRFDRAGVELNLGAIGKGHALDRVAIGMRASGVAHALLSAGRSSLLAVGGRDRGWHVEVVSPRVIGRPLAHLWLRDAALGTSGSGEQFMMVDGTRYGHVIDPRSGRPADGVLSASVVASSAAEADGLSTAFFIGGAGLARRYCDEHPDILACVTPDDGTERPLVFGSHPGCALSLAAEWAG